MSTTTATTELAIVDPEFSDAERYALAAFPAGYPGLTRDADALDLRQFIAWCDDHGLRLFAVRRADIECFARDLEARGRARATVARGGVHGGWLLPLRRAGGSPGAIPGRARPSAPPGLRVESHATGLDRNEIGARLVAAGLASAREHALVFLLAINGLRQPPRTRHPVVKKAA